MPLQTDLTFDLSFHARRGPKAVLFAALIFALFALSALAGLAGVSNRPDVLSAREQRSGPAGFPAAFAAPAQRGSEEELAKGKFLVAGPELTDPNFAETVILLLEYGDGGAMGLIINLDTAVSLSRLLPGIEGLKDREDTIFIGGPVRRGGVLTLIRSNTEIEESQRVFGQVYVSSSADLLERMIDEAVGPERLRSYAGYAGWGAGQLDAEMLMGSWRVMAADADTVFDPEPATVWERLIGRSNRRFARNLQP